MKVFLDTSIILQDRFFSSTISQLFLIAISESKYEVCLSKVVYDETRGNYQAWLEEKIFSYEKAVKNLKKALVFPDNYDFEDFLSGQFIEAESNRYMEELKELLCITEVLPVPVHSHDYILKKIREEKKPFTCANQAKDQGKDNGYKDELIWKTILLSAASEDTCFISANTKDFANDSESSLHEDLLEDLNEAGISHTRVKYYKSVQEFYEAEVNNDSSSKRLLKAIEEDSVLGKIKDWSLNNLSPKLHDVYIPAFLLNCDYKREISKTFFEKIIDLDPDQIKIKNIFKKDNTNYSIMASVLPRIQFNFDSSIEDYRELQKNYSFIYPREKQLGPARYLSHNDTYRVEGYCDIKLDVWFNYNLKKKLLKQESISINEGWRSYTLV